jgi:hypothetical protein
MQLTNRYNPSAARKDTRIKDREDLTSVFHERESQYEVDKRIAASRTPISTQKVNSFFFILFSVCLRQLITFLAFSHCSLWWRMIPSITKSFLFLDVLSGTIK